MDEAAIPPKPILNHSQRDIFGETKLVVPMTQLRTHPTRPAYELSLQPSALAIQMSGMRHKVGKCGIRINLKPPAGSAICWRREPSSRSTSSLTAARPPKRRPKTKRANQLNRESLNLEAIGRGNQDWLRCFPASAPSILPCPSQLAGPENPVHRGGVLSPHTAARFQVI